MSYQQAAKLGMGAMGTMMSAYLGYKSVLYYVEPGHRAIKFHRVFGVQSTVYNAGYNVKLPWFERPIIYDIKTHPRVISSVTGSKDLQMVNVKMRVLVRPNSACLPELYRYLGMDYDGRVLPSIGNEVLKSVIARYSAT